MINIFEVNETNKMIEQENLDVRTITMGISLLDCMDSDLAKTNENIYNKITKLAGKLVETGDEIGKEFGIPIVNKRISITPMAIVGSSCCKTSEDFVEMAKNLDKIAKELGVKVRYTATTWPTINTDVLDAARFDIANCGITITEKRLETLDMSDGYLENGKTIICRKEDSSRFTSLEALNQEGVRVMVNPGGLNEKFARENLPKATLFIHEHNEKIPGKIAAGEADLMICETTEAPLYVKYYPVQ